MDIWTKEKRSRVMALILSKNTKPEMAVRKAVNALGFRFRTHDKDLPGKPDLVLRRYKKIIFVHGCFWHQHSCEHGGVPKSRTEYWEPKLAANKKRDRRALTALKKAGWSVLLLWECQIEKKPYLIERKLKQFLIKVKPAGRVA